MKDDLQLKDSKINTLTTVVFSLSHQIKMCYIGSAGAMPMANRNRKYKTTTGIQASRHQSASESA